MNAHKRKFFLPAFVLLAVLTMAFAPAKVKWIWHKSVVGKYKIKFPGTPKLTETIGDDNITYKASMDLDGNTFFSSATVHETELLDHKDLATISVEAFVSSVKGELESSHPWLVKDNTGVAAFVQLPGDVLIEYSVILIGQYQYQIVVGGAEATFPDADAEKFFASFKPAK